MPEYSSLGVEAGHGRLSERTIAIVGGITLAAAVLGFGAYSLLDKTEHGTAYCSALSARVVDNQRQTVEVKPKVEQTGKARFSGMTYIFDANRNSVTYQTSEAVHYEYPTSATDLQHKITAVVDYRLNGKEYGGLPVCTSVVNFEAPRTTVNATNS